MKVLKHKPCEQTYKKVLHATVDDTIICAGYNHTPVDACQGDSGGPLMVPLTVDGSTKMFQIGLVSNGYKCATKPGLYTSVGKFIEWIMQTINL